MQIEKATVPVWDPFVRVFHWSLVTAYLVAWVSAEGSSWVHDQIGYFILAMIGLRIVWGLIGTRHARFGDFVHSPRQTLEYLRSLRSGRPRHYPGHNPAGGWMILALFAGMLAAGASGIMIEGAHEEFWEEIHEASANLTLFLVVLHVGGVITSSFLHGENLVTAMLTGKKKRRNAHV